MLLQIENKSLNSPFIFNVSWGVIEETTPNKLQFSSTRVAYHNQGLLIDITSIHFKFGEAVPLRKT
jgi:hypothetical protein